MGARIRVRACAVAALAVARALGAHPVLKAPETATSAEIATAVPVANDQGQQLAVSVGAAAGDEMPADAKDAYSRGFQAWAAGDLPGAKAAFTDAMSRAPKAGGPRYSLGCVTDSG